MKSCQSCAMRYVPPAESAYIDELVCRPCQKSPAVQMRVQLARSRKSGVPFERAWELAFKRVRWPHDTAHRKEWKDVLSDRRVVRSWRSAYLREDPEPREVKLALVADAA